MRFGKQTTGSAKMKRVLNAGNSIMLFPEGGYNNTEEKLINRLFAGPWLLAKECGTEVVPIISFNDYGSKDIYISAGSPIQLDLYEKKRQERCFVMQWQQFSGN